MTEKKNYSTLLTSPDFYLRRGGARNDVIGDRRVDSGRGESRFGTKYGASGEGKWKSSCSKVLKRVERGYNSKNLNRQRSKGNRTIVWK